MKKIGLLSKALLAFLTILALSSIINIAPKTQAQTGSTYYLSPTGNDSNPGTSAAPWLTLSRAQSTLAAGDTLIAKGGTYNHDYFMSQRSGTASAAITIKNATGETPVFLAQSGEEFTLQHSYYILDGLNFKIASGVQSVAEFLRIEDSGAQHNIVRNSTFTGTVIDSIHNTPLYNCIVIINNANYNTIQNNTVSLTGNNETGYGDEGNIILIVSASYNKILNNTLANGWHQGIAIWNSVGPGANYNEVRGNKIDQTHGGTGIGLGSWLDQSSNTDHNLVENNVILSAGGGITILYFKAGIQINSSYNTIRGNVFANGKAVALQSVGSGGPSNNNFIYNNTIYNNKISGLGLTIDPNYFNINSALINNIMANNICYKNDQRLPGSESWGLGTIDIVENGPPEWSTFAGGNVFQNNLIMRNNLNEQVIQDVDGGWFYTLTQAQSAYPKVFISNIQGDPLFVSTDPANANYLRLQSGSPAIGKALNIGGTDDAIFGKWNGGNPIQDIGAYQYSSAGGLTLQKLADKTQVRSGDIITYTINYTNGTQQSNNVKIEDPIPIGTSYVAGSAKLNGVAKTDAADSDEFSLIGSVPTWSLGNLLSNAAGYVSFQVRVN